MIWAVLQGRVVGVRAGAKVWGIADVILRGGGRAGEAGDKNVCGNVARGLRERRKKNNTIIQKSFSREYQRKKNTQNIAIIIISIHIRSTQAMLSRQPMSLQERQHE